MGEGLLTQMFHEGAKMIPTTRSGNLLQELESRQLTDEEQRIIEHRVALQRRMLAAFEKQEQARRREQLREVHPDLTDEQADRALEICEGREDEAAGRLATSPKFVRVVKSLTAPKVAEPSKQQCTTVQPQQVKPPVKRPVTYQPAPQRHPDEQTFVGVFRGRSLLPEARQEERQTSSSEPDPGEPFLPPFANVPRQSRSRIRRQRRQIARPIDAGLDAPSRSVSNAEDTTIGGPWRISDRLRWGSDDSAELTCVHSQHMQVTDIREGEVESPLKETPDEHIVRKVQRLSADKALEYLNSLTPGTSLRILDILQGLDATKAGVLRAGSSFLRSGKASHVSPPRPPGSSNIGEAPSTRPKRKAAMQAAGFSQALLVRSESETETDEEMYGHAKRRKGSTGKLESPACERPEVSCANALAQQPSQEIEDSTAKEDPCQRETSASSMGTTRPPPAGSTKRPKGPRAISVRGHTNRGRVRQKSHKSAELVTVGRVRLEEGWHNQGYIFPEGFKSRVNFRSSVELDQLCVHECTVLGEEGEFWPLPTFKVVAMDRPQEELTAKSCTGCWTGILKRINGVIEAKRKAGENLPPPPKTAIAGPEYFGFNQREISIAVEALDKEHACEMYWQGKTDRKNHAAGLPVAGQPSVPHKLPRHRSAGSKSKRSRHREGSSEEDTDEEGEMGMGDDASNVASKWSAVSRHERYRQRCGGEFHDQGNPLPGWVDPITLEPVVTPAISPFGHIMGMATWKAVLSDSSKCPFTKQPLKWEQCQVLTKANLDRFASRIIADQATLQRYGLKSRG